MKWRGNINDLKEEWTERRKGRKREEKDARERINQKEKRKRKRKNRDENDERIGKEEWRKLRGGNSK